MIVNVQFSITEIFSINSAIDSDGDKTRHNHNIHQRCITNYL